MSYNDGVEPWTYQRDRYLARRGSGETQQAVRAAIRLHNGQELVRGAASGIASVHREINQIARDNPGAEFALRDLEATYQAGCIHIIGRYMFG